MNTWTQSMLLVFRALIIPAVLFSVGVLFGNNLKTLGFGAAAVRTLVYFTVQTNLFVLGWNLAALIRRFSGRPRKQADVFLRGGFTVFITVTCIVYAVFLRPYWKPEGLMVPADFILHFIVPLSFVLDWIISEKPGFLKTRFLLFYLTYPLVYLIGAMVFAAFSGIYVYPFIDLTELGVPRFLINVAALLVFFFLLGGLYLGIDRLKTRLCKHSAAGFSDNG